MRIVDAEISGFKVYRLKKTFQFGRVNRITGGNGKGKTTISEAIVWCFYGCDQYGRVKDFERLKNPHAKETKIMIGVELPASDGTSVRHEFCRIRKGRVTSLFLDGHAANQADFDARLGPMELFLSIFIPGYFGSLAIAEPAKARKLLVSMLPKLDQSEVIARLAPTDQIAINRLEMINPEFTMSNLRKEISELQASLVKVQGKIDYLQIHSMLDVPMRIVEADELRLQSLKDEFSKLISTTVEPKQHDLTPLLEKQAELRYKFYEHLEKFKQLKNKPLPKVGDPCSTCGHIQTETEVAAEIENRKEEMLELQMFCDILKNDGYELAAEIERKTQENTEAMQLFQEERGRLISSLQSEINDLNSLVNKRAEKLHLAKDLVEQQGIYEETLLEIEMKQGQLQSVKNYLLQYVEMQVAYVNSFLKMTKIHLHKVSKTTGEVSLDFNIVYGEEGTPYRSLSSSEKIRCSIELAHLLNQVQNISYPVYIDNAESIEEFDEPGTQYFVAEVVKKSALRSEIVA